MYAVAELLAGVRVWWRGLMDGSFCRKDICVPVGPHLHHPHFVLRSWGFPWPGHPPPMTRRATALCGDNSGIVDKSLNCDNIIESSKLWSFCKIGRIETLACMRTKAADGWRPDGGRGRPEVSRPHPQRGFWSMTPGKFKMPPNAC